MPLTLHVFPPAFTLPSIDAECLAAISYVSRALPRNAWALVAEPGLSEGEAELPCLRDGSTTVTGFDAIVDHLRKISNGQWDLDACLDAQQRADCLAFSSHLTQTLSPLVDLSLYICAENYDYTTRKAYGATLSFPESWAVPPKRQALAVSRTSHLGLDAKDLSPPSSVASSPDAGPTRTFDDPPRRRSNGMPKPKASITSTAAAAQKLNALIDQALAPISTLHKATGQTYLLGDRPTTLDCHALAYLSLALMPNLDNPFLAIAFQTQFVGLEEYTRKSISITFGLPVTASDALVRAPLVEEEDDEELDFGTHSNIDVGSGKVELPWRRARKRSFATVAKSITKIAMS